MPCPVDKSNDLLTNVTSKSDLSSASINETSYYSFEANRNSVQKNSRLALPNQTPSLNLLGTSLKNNLNQLFKDHGVTESLERKTSSRAG